MAAYKGKETHQKKIRAGRFKPNPNKRGLGKNVPVAKKKASS